MASFAFSQGDTPKVLGPVPEKSHIKLLLYCKTHNNRDARDETAY